MGSREKRFRDDKRIDERFRLTIPVPLSAREIGRIDDWISRQKESLPREEAMRILIAQALDVYDLANRGKRR